MKIARERKSSVLASNAVHHRIDSLTSIVALMTIGGAHVFTDASWLDPVGGLIISMMVIRAGWNNTTASLLELGDVTVDDEVKEAVRKTAFRALRGDASRGLQGVADGNEVEIRDIQGTKSGQNYLIDLELAVPSTFTVRQTNIIEEAVRARAGKKVRGLRRIRIKFISIDDGQTRVGSDFIDPDVSPRSSPEPEDMEDVPNHPNHHDHHHTNGRVTTEDETKKGR